MTAPEATGAALRDQELESILTSFDSNYVWNYGSIKDGLRDLYEKAKRDAMDRMDDVFAHA